MRNFEYHNPTRILFGKKVSGSIAGFMARDNIGKALLVAGGGSIRRNGIYDEVLSGLKDEDISVVEVWGVRPNPVLSKVREMISVARKEKVDAVLAVGGGSVIDSAKAVAAGVYMEDVWKAFESGEEVIKALPLYDVLTISATGTEMNGNAVVTNERENKKWHITGRGLYPRVSAVDPAAQFSLPWEQTVNGALDTMAHIMEFYFTGISCEVTLSLNESLMRTVVEMTDKLKVSPGDYEARASFAWASTLALNGTSGIGMGGGDWACHGIEHGISAVMPSVSHGAGLGVVFPAWIRYCWREDPEIFERWALKVWGESSVEEGVRRFREKISDWGAPLNLEELGVSVKRKQDIIASVLSSRLVGNKRQLSAMDISDILDLAAE